MLSPDVVVDAVPSKAMRGFHAVGLACSLFACFALASQEFNLLRNALVLLPLRRADSFPRHAYLRELRLPPR